MSDETYMRRALELAAISEQHGDVPVGAVIVRDGTIEAVEAGPSNVEGWGAAGFVLGVQWHPEQGSDPRLFTALVRAAMDRAAMDRAALDGAAA